jgi:hypothetical protein
MRLSFSIICQCCRSVIAGFLCVVFLFDDAIFCWDYSALVIDKWNMSMELWWDETDVRKYNFPEKNCPKATSSTSYPTRTDLGIEKELRVRDRWLAALSVSCSILLISVFISHKYVLCRWKIILYITTRLCWSWRINRIDKSLSMLHLLGHTLYHHVRVLQHLT